MRDWYEAGAGRRTGKRVEEEAEWTGSEWVRRKLGFEADAVQARLLDGEGQRVLLNCTRQWGKSTVTAARAVMEAERRAGSLTLVASPGGRQSGEFLMKARRFARRLGYAARGDGVNEMSVVFPNGSRIVGVPENEGKVRGYSGVGLLILDEAARMDEEMYAALSPMLATTEGRLWMMSTPFGRRGFFWKEWVKGGPEWERVSVRAEDCERIAARFLAEERRSKGERKFRQEYCCEFVEVEDGLFDRDLVEGALTDEVDVWERGE